MSNTKHIVVFGGTGQQGSAFVTALAGYNTDSNTPAWTIHVLTRSPAGPARLRSLPGVRFVHEPKYMDEPAAALKATGLAKGDVYGVFSVQGYVDEETEVRQGNAVVDAAAAYDVQHFIFASIAHEDDNADLHRCDGIDTKRVTEQRLKATSMTWTILHDTDFMDNWLPDQRFLIKVYRTVIFRYTFYKDPERKLCMVSTRDIGRAGARALVEGVAGSPNAGQFTNAVLPLTGDKLSMREVDEIYKKVMGEPIKETWGLLAWVSKKMIKNVTELSKFYDEGGYNVSIDETRKILPDAENFTEFLERFKREQAAKK